MGWLIAAAVIILLLILPLGASIIYNADGPLVRLVAGPIFIRLYPGKKQDPDKPKKPKKKKEKPKKEKKPAACATKKKGGPISDFYPFVKLVFDFLKDFKNKLRFDVVKFHLLMAGGDPADLAINYGKAWAIVGDAWALLETWFVIKKRDVEISCDFEGSTTLVDARIDLTITLGRMLWLALSYGVKAIREYLNFRKKRNGGTNL